MLRCYQHRRARGAGERQSRCHPQDRAITRDECFHNSLTSVRVSRFGGGQLGSLGLDLRPHRRRQVEIVQSSFQSALENSAE